jgi:DNA-binding transcriptional LysR family regulator
MYNELFVNSGLSLERLKSFLAVAEAGGMTKAAGNDPTRQSQYSRQVKDLENYFGVDLFQRRGRSVELTDDGRRLATAVRDCFGNLLDFLESCRDRPHTISFGAGESLLQWLLLPRLALLQRKQLLFEIRNLRTQEVIDQLSDLRLDFGLVRKDALTKRLRSAVLGTVRYALFVPTAMLKRHAKPSLKDVLGELPIATMGSDGKFLAMLEDAARREKVRLRLDLKCTSFPQAAKALETGRFAAILPEFIGRAPAVQEVQRIEVPFLRSQAREICLAWNPRLFSLRSQAERLCAQLKKALHF